MNNDKILLQEKADALRRDLSELDAQISKMKTEPESVKPRIESYTQRHTNITMSPKSLALVFDTPEQAEKAKAILEKMEFGEPPFSVGDGYEGTFEGGVWRGETWDGFPVDYARWHMGQARKP